MNTNPSRDRAFGKYYARNGLRVSRSELEPLPEQRMSSWAAKYFRLPADKRNPPSRIKLPESKMETVTSIFSRMTAKPDYEKIAVEDVRNALRNVPEHRIVVDVETAYVEEQSDPRDRRYVFAYTITIRNEGGRPAKLLTRHWIITDANGKVQEVRGDGVVGEQPHLKPGQGFRYSSGAVLETPVGTMHGSYLCVTDEGETFTAPIRLFMLEAFDSGADAHPLSDRILH